MKRTETACWVLDVLLSAFIFAPLVVAYWRGTWILMDTVFTKHPDISAWVSLAFGAFLVPSCYFLQTSFKLHLNQKNKFIWFFGNHIYTYVFGYGIVNLWRGVWNLLNIYTGTGIPSCVVSFSIGTGCMLLLRCSRNLQAPPGVVSLDVGPDVFTCTTRYKTKPSLTEYHIHDTLFTSLIMGTLIVFFWRGSWEFLNNVLYPDDQHLSTWVSLSVGYGTFMLMLLLQKPVFLLSKALDKSSFMFKLIIEDMYWLITNLASMCVWRGIWYLCDLYILPDNIRNSGVLTHTVGLGLLMTLLAGNCVIVRGCQVDGEFSEGEGVIFSLDYSSYFRKRFNEKQGNTNAVAPAPEVSDGNIITVSYNISNGHAMQELGMSNGYVTGYRESKQVWKSYHDGRQW